MIATPPHLEVYYASTCAPCRVELPVISEAITAGNDIRILVVSDPDRARTDLATVNPALLFKMRLAEGKNPRDRLRLAGDTDGILPFTRSVGAQGNICATWRGLLTRFRIRALLARCR